MMKAMHWQALALACVSLGTRPQGMGAPGSSAGSDPHEPIAFAVGRLDDHLVRLELRPGKVGAKAGPPEWYGIRLQVREGELEPISTFALGATGHTTVEPRFGFAGGDAGRWLLSGTLHTGGERWLELWSHGGTGAGIEGESIRRQLLSSVQLADVPPEEASLRDLLAPTVLCWQGRLFLVAAGIGGTRELLEPGEGLVWIAEYPDPSDESAATEVVGSIANARRIGDGTDPRTAVHGTDVFLTLRLVRNAREASTTSRIQVLRSGDLLTWHSLGADGLEIEVRAGYSVHASQGVLWLATPALAANSGAAFVDVWKCEIEEGTWERAVEPASSDWFLLSADENVWIVDGDSGAPLVVYRDQEGRWTGRSP